MQDANGWEWDGGTACAFLLKAVTGSQQKRLIFLLFFPALVCSIVCWLPSLFPSDVRSIRNTKKRQHLACAIIFEHLMQHVLEMNASFVCYVRVWHVPLFFICSLAFSWSLFFSRSFLLVRVLLLLPFSFSLLLLNFQRVYEVCLSTVGSCVCVCYAYTKARSIDACIQTPMHALSFALSEVTSVYARWWKCNVQKKPKRRSFLPPSENSRPPNPKDFLIGFWTFTSSIHGNLCAFFDICSAVFHVCCFWIFEWRCWVSVSWSNPLFSVLKVRSRS